MVKESEVKQMKAEEYKSLGLYRLNAMIPEYLGQALEELSRPSALNMKKKDIVALALKEFYEKEKKRIADLKNI